MASKKREKAYRDVEEAISDIEADIPTTSATEVEYSSGAKRNKQGKGGEPPRFRNVPGRLRDYLKERRAQRD